MKVSKVTTENRWNGNQRRIGITGGIASGKSSIAKYLETSKNFPILDADLFAGEALTQNSQITLEVLRRYGEQITKQKDWNRISMLLRLHGRAVCHSRSPHCHSCIIKNQCPSAFKFKNYKE